MRTLGIAVATMAALSACHGDAALAPAPPEGGARAVVASAAKVDAAVDSVPPGAGSHAWRGTYQSQAGTLYIPDDWKGVKWRVSDSTSGLGEGPIHLTLDSGGRVLGTVEGPLGPAVLAGFAVDERVTASVRPEPSGEGSFTGTLTGRIVDGRLEGTMHLSPALVDAVRVATFVLGADGAPSR